MTLAAVAIPEVLGYTSISQTPVGHRSLHDHLPDDPLCAAGCVEAARRRRGLGDRGDPVGRTHWRRLCRSGPGSQEWVALCSLTALVCGAMLLLARLLRLGFLGDFLSASVLIGFLTGVGVQVLTGQIPEMLGVSKGSGKWLSQQSALDQGDPGPVVDDVRVCAGYVA